MVYYDDDDLNLKSSRLICVMSVDCLGQRLCHDSIDYQFHFVEFPSNYPIDLNHQPLQAKEKRNSRKNYKFTLFPKFLEFCSLVLISLFFQILTHETTRPLKQGNIVDSSAISSFTTLIDQSLKLKYENFIFENAKWKYGTKLFLHWDNNSFGRLFLA